MKLIVNHQSIDTEAQTLLQLAREHNLPATGVAIAVDNKMITRQKWPEFVLRDGQQITILKAFSGG